MTMIICGRAQRTIIFVTLMSMLGGCSITRPVAVIGGNGQVLRGTATAAMSGGSFFATDGKLTCAGSYNASDPSLTISMSVQCNDGRKGIVIATRQADGLNGSGRVRLNDGSEWDFIFGDAAMAL
jgi:hypothetical protein